MASEEMSFENVDDDGRKTDACLYYKLTYEPLWAFGSGELINHVQLQELSESNK